VFCATIDPHDYDTIWIGTQFDGHIYLSEDAGQTWVQRDNGILPLVGEHSVRGITIDPNNPNIVYAAFEDFPSGAGIGPVWGEVYKSTDRGENWTRIWYGDNLARYVWIDPTNSQRVYVSTGIFDRIAGNAEKGVGILRSDNGGSTWEVLSETHGLGGLYVPSLYMHPVTPTILLAAVSDAPVGAQAPGVYVTYDGGDTWERVFDFSVEVVEISEKDPNVWYAAADGSFFRSDDAGETWDAFPLFAGGRRSGIPIDLQVDPRDEYRVFVNSYQGGNMVSTDGGETWADASRGYTGADMAGVAASPGTGAEVFAAGMRTLFRSDDGGHVWTGVVTETVGTIVIQPGSDDSSARIMAALEEGDIYHSIDGGDTWTSTQVVDIAALKNSGQISDSAYIAWAFSDAPSDPQTVYIGYAETACWLWEWEGCGGRPPGFLRSHDGGYTWELVASTPFSNVSILNLAVSHEVSSTLYVATMSGVYRSQDGGDTWQHLSALEVATPPPSGWPVAFVVATDPFSPAIIYAGTPYDGVYHSTDGGDSWVQMSSGLNANEPIYDLLPDSNREGVVYASSRGSGVFYSTNRGQTWKQAADSPQLRMRKLALSEDGSMLYVGALGTGVFRLGAPHIPNTPPTAVFDVTPDSGDTTTTFSFDGSGSSDAEDPPVVLEVRWDWEDDGVYDTGWSPIKTITHVFATSATHTIRMSVRDGGDLTDSTTRQVVVVETSGDTLIFLPLVMRGN
jgi:photosystem II stability/assembly factor-like uncharacterized protein